jgi:glycopeptide antibiotics resistance protein
MGIVLQMLSRWVYHSHLFHSVLIALAGVVVISYGFELFSKITGHGIYDFMDAVASVIGGIIGIGVVVVIVGLFVTP